MNQAQLNFPAVIWRKRLFWGVSVLGLVLLLILGGPFLSGKDPNMHGDLLLDRYKDPGVDHLFGTDKFGRDIFARVISGGRISLAIAFSVMCLSVIGGISYAAAAAFAGQKAGSAMMRMLDFLLAFPAIYLVLAISIFVNISTPVFIIMLAGISWMEIARIAHSELASVRERDYISSALAMGYSRRRVIFFHMLPNSLAPILILVPLKIADAMLLESALSFLGVGIQPPTATWGSLIRDGADVVLSAWWISAIPGILIAWTSIGFHLLGEGLRETTRH